MPPRALARSGKSASGPDPAGQRVGSRIDVNAEPVAWQLLQVAARSACNAIMLSQGQLLVPGFVRRGRLVVGVLAGGAPGARTLNQRIKRGPLERQERSTCT